jgi:two-component system, OmpR family, KDP operon response regulator KdpE
MGALGTVLPAGNDRRRIFVASGNADRRRGLRFALELEGHCVAEADTASETIMEACSGRHDVLMADALLDGFAAYALCRAIRPKSELGIIVLDEERGTGAVDALNAGADDYVQAPLVMPEVAARVRALLRRVARPCRQRLVLQDRTVDLSSREIKGPGGRICHLTPKEFLVLQCLVEHANAPRTHQGLAQAVWQRDGSGEIEYLRIVVKQLRRKLEVDPEKPRYILTERSVGYRFHMPAH